MSDGLGVDFLLGINHSGFRGGFSTKNQLGLNDRDFAQELVIAPMVGLLGESAVTKAARQVNGVP